MRWKHWGRSPELINLDINKLNYPFDGKSLRKRVFSENEKSHFTSMNLKIVGQLSQLMENLKPTIN